MLACEACHDILMQNHHFNNHLYQCFLPVYNRPLSSACTHLAQHLPSHRGKPKKNADADFTGNADDESNKECFC